ncbi:uncharacterized protein UMAG_03139 [Mycosarcoma maydis]|uniref:Uncharacterized protein n=1 Tax=Mycosarcoma maydis TaxID=5270 RepID=A0A0D1DY93_MYCMD|nr:uncharacterized protein UMAG_03139 [Ustilago maydis 521]KIS68566.1 hypothetical protein UMAG_03139 [Ustilago maydis 521]|eukprot:XP_011389603.1 hypothetical protein UMAG_03139 [Ustilago maydis 521]
MSKILRNGIPRTEDGKIDFSWKNHYGFTGFIVLLGFLFPPLAVAIRFGIGKDFFINVLLTICGIIPGHIHNWFIQNIRNNDTKARTPKWAIRYGLVDDRPSKKLAKKRQWTGRFNDRLPPSQAMVYDDQGNAHIVEEVEERRGGLTAPWNVYAGDQGVKNHKTGLVEPDQWINEDPQQPRMEYGEMQKQTRAKQSKLARFRHRRSANAEEMDPSTHSHSARRLSSSQSSTSSVSIATPENPTRSLFGPHRSGESDGFKSNSYPSAAPAISNTTKTSRRDHDIFAHEF